MWLVDAAMYGEKADVVEFALSMWKCCENANVTESMTC